VEEKPWEPPADFRPATKRSIDGAIEDALHAIESVRTALNDLEEIVELLEEVETQQRADEREIEKLRNTIRSLHGGRDRDRGDRDRDRDRDRGDRSDRSEGSRDRGENAPPVEPESAGGND
jgi:hypothetical protein